jgi:hypothetical protein
LCSTAQSTSLTSHLCAMILEKLAEKKKTYSRSERATKAFTVRRGAHRIKAKAAGVRDWLPRAQWNVQAHATPTMWL